MRGDQSLKTSDIPAFDWSVGARIERRLNPFNKTHSSQMWD